MAYIDILSPDSYGRYNRKLAKFTGLATAVYWSAILEISTKVVQKKKYDREGYFKLDRKYVTERTTLTLEDQLSCDSVLHNLGVLDVKEGDSNQIRVHLDLMISILADDTPPTKGIKEELKEKKNQKTKNKTEIIIESLTNCIYTLEPDEDLAKAYTEWLQVVYQKGVCKKNQIQIFMDTINNFTTDKEAKLEIIKLATSLSYKLADWAIQKYKEAYGLNNPSRLPEQKVATELNTEKTF